ncbi:MAG TPA: transposase [Candidatus Acidoferrum sp.]
MAGWNTLFDQTRAAFAQQRCFERARRLGLSPLTCLGRRTLSGLLCATGQQFSDWSAAYRLFECERLDSEALWRIPLHHVLEILPPAGPIVALIDDTLVRKRGRRIVGTSWRRDPLGPHFADNFIWASRFLQISLALPEHPETPASAARAIPVDLQHAPSPRKPSRRADPAGPEWQSWRAAAAASAISRRGAERLPHLRQAIVKFITPLRWENASGERRLSLLIVRPVAYRLRQGARLSYRNPAYLICSDPDLPPQQILQAYLWRWEIELNVRDEKTLLGFGQPQVRSDPAVRTTATFFVFAYALLLLALENCHLTHSPLPRPRWQRLRPQRPYPRITTSQAISLLRADMWASALGLQNKNGFAALHDHATKPFLIHNNLQSAVLYASG